MINEIWLTGHTSETKSFKVPPAEIFRVAKEIMSIEDLVKIARINYKESRGLHPSSEMGEVDWEIYESRGSHYSGMFSTGIKVTPEDIHVMHAFDYLIQVSQRTHEGRAPESSLP